MNTTDTHRNLLTRNIIFLISIGIFLFFTYSLWNYSIDDAFITFRYSENLANGHGLTFTPGEKPVEGDSNFLWLLILSAFFKIGLPTYLTAKVVGTFLTLLAGIAWFFRYKNDKHPYLWLTGPLFLICPISAFWGLCGLELGLHCLLISILIFTILDKSNWVYAIIPLVVISRPEGVAIAFTVIALMAIIDYYKQKNLNRYFIYGIVVLIVTYIILTIIRVVVFGYPFPNTFYAKTHNLDHGYKQFITMLLYLAPLSLAFVWGIFRGIKKKFTEPMLLICLILFMLQAFISSSVSPVMNFMFRYMIAFVPLMIFVSLFILKPLKAKIIQYGYFLTIGISFFIIFQDLDKLMIENNKIVETQEDVIKWAESIPQNKIISMTDMGRIPYYTNLKFNDMWGLVDEEIGHNGYDAAKEFFHFPDYFILVGYINQSGLNLRFGSERQIAYGKKFHEFYKLVHESTPVGANASDPGYYYLIFEMRPEFESELIKLRQS